MMRLSTVCVCAVLIGLGCGVYNVANRYEKTEKELNSVQGKIGGEEEAIRVLQAEWTFLTSPDRLEKISDDYLHLASIDGRQYAALDTIPMRTAMDAEQGDNGQIVPPETPGVQKQPVQQMASIEASKKQPASVTAVVKKVPTAQMAQTAQNDPGQSDEFQKILAKELAPSSHALPAPSKTPLPELSAIPVSLTETDE